MNNDKVHLTFKTDRAVSELLKLIAKGSGKTQPELINEICIDYINNLNEIARKALEAEGIIAE